MFVILFLILKNVLNDKYTYGNPREVPEAKYCDGKSCIGD